MTSRSARKRLIAANRNLSLKEEQIREILKLRVQPRLSLLDESSVTYVTAEGRGDLDREDQGPAVADRIETAADQGSRRPVAERRREMDERAIGRADHDRRVTAFGKRPDAPARDTPPSIQQPSMHV